MTSKFEVPVLYSFRRCPYAMRARIAIKQSGINVELREITLKNKPSHMLTLSPKGTVPVLWVGEGLVIDESFDIMLWALTQNDPNGWLLNNNELLLNEALALVEMNDNEFKGHLDRYKYSVRFPEDSEENYRAKGETFLTLLENKLMKHDFLMGDHFSLADAAIAPFIRQFAHVDKAWFDQSDYGRVKVWLTNFLESDRFTSIMKKYAPWVEGDEPTYLISS